MSTAGSESTPMQQPRGLLDENEGVEGLGGGEEQEDDSEDDDDYEEPPPSTVQRDAVKFGGSGGERGRRGYQNRRHTVGGGIPLTVSGNQKRGVSRSPGRSTGVTTPPDRSQSPNSGNGGNGGRGNGSTPRYMGHTAKSSTRNHVRRMSATSLDIRRDSWMNGGAVSGDGAVLLHSNSSQAANTRHLNTGDYEAVDYDSVAQRTRSYTGDNRSHHHIPGVRLGGHTATVTAQDRARMKEQREAVNRRGRSAGPPSSSRRPKSPASPRRTNGRSMSPKRSPSSFQYKTTPGNISRPPPQ